ncbi:MAG: septum formation protein Maf [Cytophagales bacterium]|nr:septum formation protein Maf [Armatimonadota bacterium]
MSPRLLLASASPRRRELLALLGVRYTVAVSRFAEETLSHLTDPVEYVRRAAEGKAEEVVRRRPGCLALGVDTDVVAPDGTILGKPKDAADAHRLLRLLSGRTHSVYSGVALFQSGPDGVVLRREVRVEETRVTFGDLPDAAIAAYVATGEPMDKAGAYGIQGGAMTFVTRIEGDLSNVIGLPLWTVGEMLTAFGVPLWGPPDHSLEKPADV